MGVGKKRPDGTEEQRVRVLTEAAEQRRAAAAADGKLDAAVGLLIQSVGSLDAADSE